MAGEGDGDGGGGGGGSPVPSGLLTASLNGSSDASAWTCSVRGGRQQGRASSAPGAASRLASASVQPQGPHVRVRFPPRSAPWGAGSLHPAGGGAPSQPSKT